VSAQDWAGIEVPGMYAVAKVGEDPESWKQATALHETLELLNFHEEQLRMARDELAEMWPPEKSPAAAAFVRHVNKMLDDIKLAQEETAANQRALALLLISLAHAKADMAALNAEYAQVEKRMHSPDRNPINYSEYGPDARRLEEINERGRRRMGQADQEVFAASNQMVQPTVSLRSDDSPSDNRLHQDGSSDSGSGRSEFLALRSVTVPSPAEVDSRLQAQPADYEGASDYEAALAAVGHGSATTAPPGAFVQPSSDKATATGGAGILPGVSMPGPASLRINPPGGGIGSLGRSSGGGHGAGVGTPPGRRVNPVGGVIGGSPASSTASPHGSSGRSTAASHPTTSGSRSLGSTGPGLAARGRRRQEPERPGDPEAYRIWPVAEGGPPVIESRPEPFHDPGPGVIGIDRW